MQKKRISELEDKEPMQTETQTMQTERKDSEKKNRTSVSWKTMAGNLMYVQSDSQEDWDTIKI